MENTFHAGVVSLLKYPGLFDLEYGKLYKLTIDGKKAAVKLNTSEKGIKIIDNKNSINLEEDKEPLNRSLLEKSEEAHIWSIEPHFEDKDLGDRNVEPLHMLISQLKDKEIFISENYYSTLLVFVEYEQFNLNIFEDEKKSIRYLKATLNALHKFITIYNSIGGINTVIDYISDEKMGDISFIARLNYFKLAPGNDFYEYVGSTPNWSFERRGKNIEDLGLYGIKELTNQKISELSEKMRYHLQGELTQESIFLSNARQLLKFGNNKYAYLEAFLAIETSVEKFLNERKKKTGVPDQNLSDFSRETGIGYQINIEIPLALGEIEQEHIALINTLNKIRKTRNNIVHRGYQVTEEEVDFAINVVQYYVVYLREQSDE